MRILRLITVSAALIALFGVMAAAQTPATGRVMRQKLGHSQKILEAILTSNVSQLERESAALSKATQAPAWTALRGPEYVRQSERFLKSLHDLETAARERDLDAAMKSYTDLTTSCFGCHRHMKDRRLAGQ